MAQPASSTIIGIFALWGLSQLIIGFLYLLGIIEYGMRAFYIGTYKPVETAGNAPGALINIPFMLLFSVMLALTLWRAKSTGIKFIKPE